MREYDQIFDWYVTERSAVVGLPEVEELTRALPVGAQVLDLGCGTGFPIAYFLADKGFELFAIDSSEKMANSFKANFPLARVACEKIEQSDFFKTNFDAVVSWGVLFHLEPAAQVIVIKKVAAVLKENGRFLFTSGEDEGSVEGVMNGTTFRYISLGAETYSRLLAQSGLTLTDRHYDEAENYVYVAVKAST